MLEAGRRSANRILRTGFVVAGGVLASLGPAASTMTTQERAYTSPIWYSPEE